MPRVFAFLVLAALTATLAWQAGRPRSAPPAPAPLLPGPARDILDPDFAGALETLLDQHRAEVPDPAALRRVVTAVAAVEAAGHLKSGARHLVLGRAEELGVEPAWTLQKLRADPLLRLQFDYVWRDGGPAEPFLRYQAERLRRGRSAQPGHLLYDQLWDGFLDRPRVELLKGVLEPLLGSVRGQDWADVGTGTGSGLVVLNEMTGRAPVAQDLDETLSPFWQALGIPGLRPAIGQPDHCGLAPGSLDGVTMHEVHMAGASLLSPEFRSTVLPWLRSLRTALRPGGTLVVTEWLQTAIPEYAEMLRQAGFSQVEIVPDPRLGVIVARK